MQTPQQKITAHNGYDLISKKILIGRLSISSLETQITYTTKSISLQNTMNETAAKKLKLVSDLNSIFEKQVTDFSEERQRQCMELYKEINQLDLPRPEQKVLTDELNTLENNMMELQKQINYLEASIPNEKLLTQYQMH